MAANGGYCNAYTEFELTNFQLQVQYSALEKALDMCANNLASPLLLKEAMKRELTAVDNEFKGVVPDDMSRMIQVLKENSTEDHIFRQMAWGCRKSIYHDDDDELWKDLRKFYDDYYSADRIKLVIQCRTPDNMVQLRGWVEEYFSIIPNKNLGKQDFSKIGFGDNTSAIGKLPFEGNANEFVLQNSYQDIQKIMFSWAIRNDDKRFDKNSMTLIRTLLDHKGKGSLFSCLTDLNYAQSFDLDENFCCKTAFRLFSMEIELSESGLLNFREVIALVFEYLRKIKEEWLANG